MKWPIQILFFCILLQAGCSPPLSKDARITQVRHSVAQGGGEEKILNESRLLFSRLSRDDSSVSVYTAKDRCFKDLPGITNLGDVFYYQRDRINVRVHNGHFDTYFISLLNPDSPEPAKFERIVGNVGFIEHEDASRPHR